MRTALLLCRVFETKEEQTRLLLALPGATSVPAKCRHTSRRDLSVKLLPSETKPTCLGQPGLHKNKRDRERKHIHIPNAVSSSRNKDVG